MFIILKIIFGPEILNQNPGIYHFSQTAGKKFG